MPQIDDHTNKRAKRPQVIVFTVLLVMVLAAVGYYVDSQWMRAAAMAAQTNALNQAATDDHAHAYKAEATVLQQYLATNPPMAFRYQPLMDLGNLALDDDNSAEALSYYRQGVAAAGGQPRLVDAESLAMAAAASGDKATAIKYYKLAIKLSPAQPGVTNNITEYKQTISDLGGTP